MRGYKQNDINFDKLSFVVKLKTWWFYYQVLEKLLLFAF